MTRRLSIAVMLMRMALALLDEEGEGLTACRLQHAIDTLGAGERGPSAPGNPAAEPRPSNRA